MNINNQKGFTLAEVIITLGIIGVVAAMTIPNLVASYQNNLWHDYCKKSYKILFDAFSQIKSDANGTLAYYFTSETDLITKLSGKISTSLICTPSTTVFEGNCWHNTGNWNLLNGNTYVAPTNYGLMSSSGILIGTMLHLSSCSWNGYGTPSGKGICASIWVDSNGFEKPNMLGKDIFYFWINEDGVIPIGLDGTTGTIATSCSTAAGFGSYAGWGCSRDYLLDKNYRTVYP